MLIRWYGLWRRSDYKTSIYIHIGLPKTATTFLQRDLFPKLGINLIKKPSIYNINIKQGKQNLITSETLTFDLLKKPNRYVMMKRMHDMFPNAKILFCTRETESWLKSVYNLYLYNGYKKSYEEFYDEIDKDMLDTDKFIIWLKKTFKEVHTWEYKKNLADEIKGICEFLGCDVPPYKNIMRNPSVGPKKMHIQRYINNCCNEKIFPILVKKMDCDMTMAPNMTMEKLINTEPTHIDFKFCYEKEKSEVNFRVRKNEYAYKR